MPSDTPPPSPEELAVKRLELEARELEAKRNLTNASLPWWRRADPLAVAIFAGALTLLGNMVVAVINSRASVGQEEQKAKDDLNLEKLKSSYNLVLQAMATNDVEAAKRNITFFVDAGLLNDDDCKIRNAIEKDQPVLPSLSGTAPSTPPGLHSTIEIANLYNFPPDLDGRGVTVGILEFAGTYASDDLKAYFGSLKLPVPDVASVLVDGAESKSEDTTDTQVTMDVEIIGALAPRAKIRVYFAPFSSSGFEHAIARASADGVAVVSNGWGKPESEWKTQEIDQIDAAIKSGAEHGMTFVAAAGDGGVTDGLRDDHRHVDYPASSPWVLSVGGTALKSDNGRIVSETVWNSIADSATGGGVSDKFDRPDWQALVSVPKRENGLEGRGVPDVVASADPLLGVALLVHGRPAVELRCPRRSGLA